MLFWPFFFSQDFSYLKLFLFCELEIKVLPVMVMGAFIPGLRRKYPLQEYISAMLLVLGLILFTLADAQTSPNFHIFGVIMISGALIMDAFLGNLQEAIFTLNPDTTQVRSIPYTILLIGVRLHKDLWKRKGSFSFGCRWRCCSAQR